MIITSIEYKIVSHKLKTSFKSSVNEFNERNICLLKVTNSDGISGTGECAPLPGFSQESFGDLINSILCLKSLLPVSIDENFYEWCNQFKISDHLPSLKFGLEQALFSLFEKTGNFSLPVLTGMAQKSEINLNAIIGMNEFDNLDNLIFDFRKRNFDTIKVKIRDKEQFPVIEKIHTIAPELKIRIDVNGNWKTPFIYDYLEYLSKFNIEYIEQPIQCLDDLIYIQKYSPLPLAADESVTCLTDAEYAIKSNIKFLIIKPTVFGGISESVKLIKFADNKSNIIISSVFESLVAMKMLFKLAALTSHSYSHGLSTLRYYSEIKDDNLLGSCIGIPALNNDYEVQEI